MDLEEFKAIIAMQAKKHVDLTDAEGHRDGVRAWVRDGFI